MKDLRQKYLEPEYKDQYHMLEQALFDEILTRKMDDEAIKGGALGGLRQEAAGEGEPQAGNDEDEYVAAEVWVEEYQCWIAGLAKRGREEDSEEDDREDKRQKADQSSPPGAKTGKEAARKEDHAQEVLAGLVAGRTSKGSAHTSRTKERERGIQSLLLGLLGDPVPSQDQPRSSGTHGSQSLTKERAKEVVEKERARGKARARAKA